MDKIILGRLMGMIRSLAIFVATEKGTTYLLCII